MQVSAGDKPKQLILKFAPSHRNVNGDIKRAAVSKVLAVQRLLLMNVQEEEVNNPKRQLLAGEVLWQSEIRRVRSSSSTFHVLENNC